MRGREPTDPFFGVVLLGRGTNGGWINVQWNERREFSQANKQSEGLSKEQVLPIVVAGCRRKIEASLHVEILSDKFKENVNFLSKRALACFLDLWCSECLCWWVVVTWKFLLMHVQKYYSFFSIKEGREFFREGHISWPRRSFICDTGVWVLMPSLKCDNGVRVLIPSLKISLRCKFGSWFTNP